MNDVLVVTEAAVRGLSISRLRLLIFLLQGHVVSKPGNLKYSDRAVRILAAGKQPFYAAQWEAVQALAQNAKFDLQLFGSLKEAADHAISTGPSPRRAHFVPTPPPAASDTGPVDSDDDWQSVEGPSADPQGRAAPEFKGLELAENPFGRLAILEAGMEDEATSPIDHSRSKLEGDLLQVATADPGPYAGPAKRAKRSHGAASLPVAGASQALSLGAMDPAHPVPPPFREADGPALPPSTLNAILRRGTIRHPTRRLSKARPLARPWPPYSCSCGDCQHSSRGLPMPPPRWVQGPQNQTTYSVSLLLTPPTSSPRPRPSELGSPRRGRCCATQRHPLRLPPASRLT